MRTTVLVAAIAGLLAGCPAGSDHSASTSLATAVKAPASQAASALGADSAALPIAHSSIAALPDRGSFIDYGAQAPVRRGAAIWHPVQMSEAHALAAISAGGMVVSAPDGAPIKLQYVRHVVHPDGNWTWVGRPQGAGVGQEAILTFGPKAVFGSIPNGNGDALEVTTSAGRTWMVETDKRIAADQRYAALTAPVADALQPPAPAASVAATASTPMMASAARASAPQTLTAKSSSAVVDLVLGYTTAFATRLGGTSQANTRLNFMVDVANQAFANSRVSGRVRLVNTVQVNYPDATVNRTALFELSGLTCTAVAASSRHLPDGDVNCTASTVPTALQPLIAARNKYGADLVSLVRMYQVPENQSCGVSWLIGGGQQAVTSADAKYALSVISDSSGSQFPDNGSTCRDETLAHEMGHNMGLAHDPVAAAGTDDSNSDGNTLDPQEYGRYPYSFGYSTDTSNGNFYTVMALPVAGQTSYRLFSNPRITDCGGAACGVAGQSDNAGTLSLTMPVVANFSGAKVQTTGVGLSGDFNGDGKADILWRDSTNGNNAIWRSGNSATPQTVHLLADRNWVVAGIGDFNGDHKADILWRHSTNGRNAIWYSANSTTTLTVQTMSDLNWEVAGIGDFNGDGKSDILWRNAKSGANVIWKSGNSQSAQAVTVMATNVVVAGVGDFNGDGNADILWHNTLDGGNVIWRSGNSATRQAVTQVTDTSWTVAGVADINGDSRADIVWRKASTGSNAIWLSASSAHPAVMHSVGNLSWTIVGLGDFNGDGRADVLFRNSSTAANSLWLTANSSTQQPVTTVALKWVVAG